MNDQSATPRSDDGLQPMLDAGHPWLGLASFTEETRAYFHGREDEVAELARRVQRKLLTVLFGQSGLGKTSILRAGLVPRLKAQGYCPVYVRIDYSREAPEPADQIKQAIARTARSSGQWTQAGVAVAGESLWEFLHHRDDVLKDEAGNTLIPLVIFDQFEEIFTLAQTDDFGRARAARFVADLADLVENRPPAEFEARLERDEAAAEQFDFARSDYRVLIALREDYLAPLEGLKAQMPSITQNRLRLAPMTGAQALEAVMKPGGGLVSREVAEAIVRFVAGGAEIANAEVEPSLLSLICRELNEKRLAQGRPEITQDLLAGSHTTILSEFYERSLADQPDAVRRVIEDELLTASGFRENVAEERILASFAAARAAPDTLATLVNRRLLRVEERLDVRRVELTHDVLCGVVRASRDLRHEREARDRTERELADQRERELAARRGLVRARKIAAGCAVLAAAALVALAIAFTSTLRARRAEQLAEQTRSSAERARTEAEHLLGYLNDDFATALEGFGDQTLVANLGRREVGYYDSLPAELQTQDTVKSAALARARYGIALQKQFALDEAWKQLTAAVNALSRLRSAGDDSEATAVALGLALSSQADVVNRRALGAIGKTVDSLNEQAETLLRPYASAPHASVAARRAYAIVATSAGSYATDERGFALFERGRDAYASIGALDLSDLSAAADTADNYTYDALLALRVGRYERLRDSVEKADALARRVLERQPGHLIGNKVKAWAAAFRANEQDRALHLREALATYDEGLGAGLLLTRMDPTNVDEQFRAMIEHEIAAGVADDLGDAAAARRYLDAAVSVAKNAPELSADTGRRWARVEYLIAEVEADRGNTVASSAALAEGDRVRADVMKSRAIAAASAYMRAGSECWLARARAEADLARGDGPGARARLAGVVEAMSRLAPGDGDDLREGPECIASGNLTLARAALEEGDAAAAERAAAAAVATAVKLTDQLAQPELLAMRARTLRTIALAKLGRLTEANAEIRPVLAFEHERSARNMDSARQRFDAALAHYAASLADPREAATHLREAQAGFVALPASFRARRAVAYWSGRAAQASHAGGPGP